MDSSGFFSKPISTYNGKIPFIVKDIIDKLREINAKNIEGIFRLSSSQSKVQKLTDELDKGPINDWSQHSDAIALACVLKNYFRHQAKTDPLMTYDYYDLLVAFATIPDETIIPERIKKACMELEPSRLNTLAFLMNYLYEIQLNKNINKMNAQNLAICFAPNILAAREQTHDTIIDENPQQIKIVRIIIEQYQFFFNNFKFDSNLFISNEEMEIYLKPKLNNELMYELMKRRSFRKKTLIPYTPSIWFENNNFKRPNWDFIIKEKK